MVTITRPVARAMSAQLNRVNNDPDTLRERIGELEDQIALLREMNKQKDRRIFDLEDQLTAAESGARLDVSSAPQTYQGRPVLTPTQAAARAWISRSSVNRYLTSGYWAGVQLPGSNRWLVYADQPLSKKKKS